MHRIQKKFLLSIAVAVVFASCEKADPWIPPVDIIPEQQPSPEPEPEPKPDPIPETKGWLELPAVSKDYPNGIQGTFYAGKDRNYSYLYDPDTYTSYWVAYPLYVATQGGSRQDSWSNSWNPDIDQKKQVATWLGGYGVNFTFPDNFSDYYARGHQIPDADRSGNAQMQKQTYYATNMTPQLQNNFNGAVWMYLEGQVRTYSKTVDTLYVVTGAILSRKGMGEKINYITPTKDSGKSVPVPNYYYKVLLKVGRSSGKVSSASAIGFWMPHYERYKSPKTDWQNYVTSVDQIEEYTGFDFFSNLSEELQRSAESVTDLNTFANFR